MELKGYEKAALFLNLLGEDLAGEIIKQLDAKEVKKITLGLSKLQNINKDMIDSVKKEVKGIIECGIKLTIDEHSIRSILSKKYGEEEVAKIFEEAEEETKVESFENLDSSTVLNFIVSEHPQTITSIICALEPKKAAEVFSKLPDGLQFEVAMRLINMEKVSEKALKEVLEIFKIQFSENKIREKKINGIKILSDILNFSDKNTEEFILNMLDEKDTTLAEKIRSLMFVFDDLVKLDDRSIQMLLKEVSTEDLVIALKSASEALKEKIFKNMSQRAVQILKDEMESKGPVKISDVEKAQQNIVKVARKLESEGRIVLGGKGDEVVF